jgi:hypothetical protein
MAKGHSSDVIVLSHLEMAWFSIECAAARSVPFECSTRPFCHWAFTPLKLRCCFLLSIAFWNVSERNAPLSACYDLTVTWYCCANFS